MKDQHKVLQNYKVVENGEERLDLLACMTNSSAVDSSGRQPSFGSFKVVCTLPVGCTFPTWYQRKGV